MKIAQITPYYPPADGGIAVFVKELSNALTEKGNELLIISRDGPENYNIRGTKRQFTKQALSMLTEFEPDMIHSHSDWITMKAAVEYHKNATKKPKLIFTFHTGLINPLTGIKKIIYENMLSKFDVITFVSFALQDEFFSSYKLLPRTEVVYAGVKPVYPTSSVISDFLIANNLKKTNIIISFVGPFEWPKKVDGIKLLMKSVSGLIESNKNIKIVLVGDGTYRHELESLAQHLEIQDNVVFTGFHDNVYVPLQASSIYAHISMQEGLPLALLEAMSVGIPVIACPVGGIPEIIENGKNGLLAEPNMESIRSTLAQLIVDEKLRIKMGESAKATSENFTWEKTAEKFMKIYTEADS